MQGVRLSLDNINIAIYDRSKGFLKFENVFRADGIAATKTITHFKISDLPKGEYAMVIFHDKNGNDKLDTNWLGITIEAIAFSNAKIKPFGPPSFKECAFNLDRDMNLRMELE